MEVSRFSSQPIGEHQAPTLKQVNRITEYDIQHLGHYLRLLDAQAGGADWEETAEKVLNLDHRRHPIRAWIAWSRHLSRARWLCERGYGDLLEHPATASITNAPLTLRLPTLNAPPQTNRL